jgi:hypothetical protein
LVNLSYATEVVSTLAPWEISFKSDR